MQIKTGLFFLSIFFMFHVNAGPQRNYPQSDQDLQKNSIIMSSIKLKSEQTKLAEIKYLILNGNLVQARSILQTTSFENDTMKNIKTRYLALIAFSMGEYEKTLEVLDTPSMKEFFNIGKICQIKILSEIILRKNEEANTTWKTCKEATFSDSENGLFWLNTIIQLNQIDGKNISESLFKKEVIENMDKEYLRLYLKLALYLNKQDEVIPRFKYFSKIPFEDTVLRELIGLNYYRSGQLVKAHQILKDLDTANAELFKGNIFLVQKQFEKAYAQFKLTLKRKSNSENALERLIPLSWKLKQYSDGIDFIQKVNTKDQDKIKQLTLLSLFLTTNRMNTSALETVKKILKLTNKGEALEVSQLRYVNSLLLKKTANLTDPLHNACQYKDGLACWLLLTEGSWDTFFDYVNQNFEIKNNPEIIKEYTTSILPPFEETELIEQKHIEELDEKMLKLSTAKLTKEE